MGILTLFTTDSSAPANAGALEYAASARLASIGGDTVKQIHPTREAWLEEAMSEVSVQFKRLGFPLPKKIRVTCGFTSGGTRKRPGGKVLIGECWDSSKSGDKSFEIMVSPTEADPVRVLGILVHELAHAAAGLAAGSHIDQGW